MSAAEFVEWMAYDRIDPGGPWRDDYRAGIIASAVVNARAFRPKNDKGVTPQQFIPTFEPKKPQTWQDQLLVMKLWTAALGGTHG